MAEPSLSDVFGGGASQTSTQLVISKNDLASVGLSPSGDNSAESMLVALILKAAQSLTDANRASDPSGRSVTVFYSGQDLITQASQSFRRDAFSMLLYKPETLAPVSPGDY